MVHGQKRQRLRYLPLPLPAPSPEPLCARAGFAENDRISGDTYTAFLTKSRRDWSG